MMDQARSVDANALIQRVRRLFMLDTTVFDEIRGDATSTVPAFIVAVVSTLLFGLGGWLWWLLQDYPSGSSIPSNGEMLLRSVIIGGVISLVLWGVWLGLTYIMLTQVFRARADIQELLRVMGFAAAPLALGVLLFIPQIEWAIGLTTVVLFFGANLIAVQSATDAPAGRVLASVGAGFFVWALILAFFVGDDSVYAPGFFIFELGVELLRY